MSPSSTGAHSARRTRRSPGVSSGPGERPGCSSGRRRPPRACGTRASSAHRTDLVAVGEQLDGARSEPPPIDEESVRRIGRLHTPPGGLRQHECMEARHRRIAQRCEVTVDRRETDMSTDRQLAVERDGRRCVPGLIEERATMSFRCRVAPPVPISRSISPVMASILSCRWRRGHVGSDRSICPAGGVASSASRSNDAVSSSRTSSSAIANTLGANAWIASSGRSASAG